MVIISPYEAHELLPVIQKSSKVTLHLYAARLNKEVPPLDNLDLYTVLPRPEAPPLPPLQPVVLLNLFAGQLHSFNEYIALCNMLPLSWQRATDDVEIAADGFILSSRAEACDAASVIRTSRFTQSPVPFLKVLMSIRRDGQSIDKTHVGKLLDGTLLDGEDGLAEEPLGD